MNIQLSPIVEQPDIGSGLASRPKGDRKASFEAALDSVTARDRAGADDVRPEPHPPEPTQNEDVDRREEDARDETGEAARDDRDDRHDEQREERRSSREREEEAREQSNEQPDDGEADPAERPEDDEADEGGDHGEVGAGDSRTGDDPQGEDAAGVVVPVVTTAAETAGAGKAKATDRAAAIRRTGATPLSGGEAEQTAGGPTPGTPLAVAASSSTGGNQSQSASTPSAGGESLLDATLHDAITSPKAGSDARAPSGEEAKVTTAQEAGGPKATDAARRSDAPPPPRQVDPRLLRLAEANRSSVFRQIAVHLTGSGGEMHLHLDPPELGAIEMQLTDKNGVLRLQIFTERPEVNNLIERHVGELRQSLAEQGLSLSETHIEARDRGTHGGAGNPGDADGRSGGDDTEHDDGAPRAHHAYITAEGLDFYV